MSTRPTVHRIAATPVDALGCWLDSPAEPNTVHLEATITGHLDPGLLRAAVLATLDAHPRARARLVPPRPWHRRLAWQIADGPDFVGIDTVRWANAAEFAVYRHSLLGGTPSPELGPPLRVRHAIGPDRDVLLLSAHHALLDGLSSLRLLRSIARRYACRLDPVPADPFLSVPPPSGNRKYPRLSEGARVPARIAPDRAAPVPGYDLQCLTLPCWPHPRDRPAAAGTVNDVLIAALAMTIAAWNAAHRSHCAGIRITMPINMRPPGEPGDPLGNFTRLASIGIGRDPRENPLLALAGVTAQTRWAKGSGGPQLDPISRVLAAPWAPVPVRARLVRLAHRLGARWFSDTSMVSNLGVVSEPLDFGPRLPVGQVWLGPPAPMPRGLALGAITVRDELHLCFRYRRALFDEAAAVWFVELFRRALATIGDPRLVPGTAA